MNEHNPPDFVVIDDDSINNLICTEFIKLTLPGAEINTFTSPEKGLEHLMNVYSGEHQRDTVLFLDINMPLLSGWEVLKRFDVFPAPIKGKVKIFMLSSSVDPLDIAKADGNPLVLGYVSKFLSQEKLRAIFPLIGGAIGLR